MTLSSGSDGAALGEIIATLIDSALDERVVAIARGGGGANSKGYVATTRGGNSYFVKQYRHDPGDGRDRLGTEFAGLAFLWENGVRRIPRPLCQARGHNLGVYEYIPGRKLQAGELTLAHLGMAAEFLGELQALGQAPGAERQPLASESCLTLQGYVAVVEKRLARFQALPEDDELSRRLRRYLGEIFTPLFRQAEEILLARAEALGLAPAAELERERRILSPSDFGFHNVLLTGDGRLTFVDFEYFGWDDPAKLIADFYLQPALPLAPAWREYFFARLDFLAADEGGLGRRLPLAYLLSALKWALLLLNCFLEREAEARPQDSGLREERLHRSQQSLSRLQEELAGKQFPLDSL